MSAERPAATDRARFRTMKNMVWGLLACLAVVALIGLVVQRPADEKITPVDYSGRLAAARKVSPYPVLAPEPLPQGWTATSAQATGEPGQPFTWHLGVISDQRRYVGLEQSNGDAQRFLADKVGATVEDGTSTVAGTTWQRRVATSKDDHALIRTANGVTTIVTSTADYAVLESYAAALKAPAQ